MSASVVPARAGMSPAPALSNEANARGPRASGDEPLGADAELKTSKWSPRERG